MRKKICLFLVISFFLNFSGITVLATDPPVRPEEMIGSADVRYVVDSLRETVRAVNTPGTGTLILLNAMKEKISTQLSTAEKSYPELIGSISDTDQIKIESIIAEGIAKTNELIEKISAVIATPVEEIRVEQLDAIILMLDDAADMQGNILSTRPDLPNKLVSGTKEFKPRPVKATGADPTPEDLVETPEIQITPRIQELADNLNNDPVEIFTWVRNNIDYEPYYGSLKGSNETLIDMAGNDCDQSSLLIALLRASDIPARYVRGDVELKIEDLMNWTGGETPEAAVKIMQSNWIPTQVLYKFDAIEGVIFDHIWVEIFGGHVWRLADPSYKEYVYTEGTEITSEQKDALANLMEGTVTISEDEKSFSANQELIEFAMEEAARILEGSVNSGREILVNEKNNLPPYLARGIIGDRKPAEEFAEMPDDMRFKVRVAFPDLDAHTFLMADVAGKTLSITYEMQQMPWLPENTDIFNAPPMFTLMKPQLRVDNLVVAEGNSVYLGTYHNLEVSLLRPGVDTWEIYNKGLIAGSSANICLTTQETSAKFMQEKVDALKAVMDISSLTLEDTMTVEMVNESLRLDGLMYFTLMDYITNIVSNQMGIINVNHVSLAFIVDEIIPIGFFGLVFLIKKGGAHIDIVRTANNPVSATGNAEDRVKWMQIQGGFGTNMEHTMLETMYDIEAVSTGKIFSEANKAGIPIRVIKPETLEDDLAQISAHSVVKDHIRAFLMHETREFEALIPQRGITLGSWSGQGWIIMEPSTGCAGYMICGGLHNSNMILNGGSLIEKLNNAISELAQLLAMAHGVAEAFIVGTISLALAHFVAAMILLAEATIITSLFGIWFAAIGACLAIVSLAILIQMLKNAMHHARYIIPSSKGKPVIAFA